MLQPTWKDHGPVQCQKQHMAWPSCKWYLFEMNRKMFRRVKSTEEEMTSKKLLTVEDDAENTLYSPTNEDLKKWYTTSLKTKPYQLP